MFTKKCWFYALLFICLCLTVYGHAGHDHDHEEEGEEMELDESMFSEEESGEEEGSSDDDNSTEPYKLDQDVIVLNAKNFDRVVKMFPLLLVEFYAPWCGHCKQLAPKYAEAASILKKLDTPLYIAKLDAANKQNSDLAKKYEVQGFPTLKLFRNSTEPSTTIPYNSGRTTEDIVNYMKRKYEPVNTIKNKESLTKLLNSNEVVAVFYAEEKDTELLQIVHDLATADDRVVYAITSDKSIFEESDRKALGEKGLILFKDFDEGKNVYSDSDFSKEKLAEFVSAHKMPLVMTFSQDKVQEIFGGNFKIHLLVFSNAESDYHKLLIENTKKAAEQYHKDILHVFVPHSEANIVKHFKLEEEDLPSVILIVLGSKMVKYTFPLKGKDLVNAINNKKYADQLVDFEKRYLAGKLEPTLSSEEPIDDSKDAVKYVVGKEFKKRVIDSKKDVLLEFYAPWCGHCKALAPIYEELAEKLKSVDSIMIAKMDHTANEINYPGVDIEGYPTIYFFPKNGEPVPFKEPNRDLDTLLKFVQNHSSPFELDGKKYGTEKEELKEEVHEEL